MVLMLQEATPEERRRFYAEEWNRREIPDFLLQTLSLREFGFDLDGRGPNNRYNQFTTVDQLGDFLRYRAPFSAYASVALYERPAAREGWLKAELALDIDAKDLPIKACACSLGNVCEKCIDEARLIAKQFGEVLARDLGLRNINYVYSGRGFHVRVFDDSVMSLGGNERGQIVDYLTGKALPPDVTMTFGYPKVFRERVARTFNSISEDKLIEGSRMQKPLAEKLMKEKTRVIEMIQRGKLEELSEFDLMGELTLKRFLEFMTRTNSEFTDGKVTIDTKRILRLPSSLHSGVSMKCMHVRDIDRFRLEDAVPKFVRERASA